MRDRKSDTHHRKVAEAKIGRKLQKNEVAHHVNEDKSDDTPANISVDRRGSHTAGHNKHRQVSRLRKALRMVRDGQKLYMALPLLWGLQLGYDARFVRLALGPPTPLTLSVGYVRPVVWVGWRF